MSRRDAKAWQSLACEQKLAAGVLREHDLYGPCASRAYYAAYSLVTSALIAQGMSSFGRFRNPDHASLPGMTSSLRGVPRSNRVQVAKSLRQLRSRREDADYRPGIARDASMAREAMRDLSMLDLALHGRRVA